MKKGWQTKKVSEIAKHSLGKMLDKQKNKGTPRPYLRNLNVRWFEFDLSDLSEMPFLDEEAEKFTAVMPPSTARVRVSAPEPPSIEVSVPR